MLPHYALLALSMPKEYTIAIALMPVMFFVQLRLRVTPSPVLPTVASLLQVNAQNKQDQKVVR